ncbi:MAG: hypothetical protein AB1715_09205, partial [Acidobacteriota bacterium]
MKKRNLVFIAVILLAMFAAHLLAAKMVRVMVRAPIYIEPSRTSSRIEIVEKGTLLNLLQPTKVKDIWYYVSFTSPRYGTRVSGFILESAVELVPEEREALPPVKKEKREELTLSVPPKSRAPEFPSREKPRQDLAWKPLIPPQPEVQETKVVEAVEFPQLTAVLRQRKV